MNFDALASKWEATIGLRRLAAAGKGLVVPTAVGLAGCLGSIKDCRENYDCLKCVLQIMAAAGSVDTPPVEILGVSTREFFELAHYPIENDIPAIGHRDAWSIKRNLTFLKRKWVRQEYPKDSILKLKFRYATCVSISIRPDR